MLHKMFCDNETQTRQDKGMAWHGPTYTTYTIRLIGDKGPLFLIYNFL